MKTNFIPMGFQYYRAPTPASGEWEKDLENIKKDIKIEKAVDLVLSKAVKVEKKKEEKEEKKPAAKKTTTKKAASEKTEEKKPAAKKTTTKKTTTTKKAAAKDE